MLIMQDDAHDIPFVLRIYMLIRDNSFYTEILIRDIILAGLVDIIQSIDSPWSGQKVHVGIVPDDTGPFPGIALCLMLRPAPRGLRTQYQTER